MTTTDELMRLTDAVADAGTQMLPAVEIASRLAALRTAIQEVVEDAERYRCIRDPEFHANNAELVATNYETGDQLDAAIDVIRNTASRSGG